MLSFRHCFGPPLPVTTKMVLVNPNIGTLLCAADMCTSTAIHDEPKPVAPLHSRTLPPRHLASVHVHAPNVLGLQSLHKSCAHTIVSKQVSCADFVINQRHPGVKTCIVCMLVWTQRVPRRRSRVPIAPGAGTRPSPVASRVLFVFGH